MVRPNLRKGGRQSGVDEAVDAKADCLQGLSNLVPLEAFIDSVTPEGLVTGWCWDPNDPARQVELDVMLDGKPCTTVHANLTREDLIKAGKGTGRYGFAVVVHAPDRVWQPSHVVSLSASKSNIQIGTAALWQRPETGFQTRLEALESQVAALIAGTSIGRAQAPQATADQPSASAQLAPQKHGLRLIWLSGESNTPGHSYRVLDMVETAIALGHDATWLPAQSALGHLRDIENADALFIWRAPLTHELSAAISVARKNQASILFDVDDLMVEPALAAPDIIDAIRSERYDVSEIQQHYEGIRETARLADAVLVTTRELGLFAQRLHKAVHVLPNGFNTGTLARARAAFRRKCGATPDGLIRIGYAGGSRTHQADFATLAGPLARVLSEFSFCRLVLFRAPDDGRPLLIMSEFPDLADYAEQIEWRDMVPVDKLPDEMARFDVNLAPLKVGNPFCEAKSELKFFEAALAGVPTIASPTGPFRRAIRDGETGLLADDPAEWAASLRRLILDAPLRRRMAQAAYHDVLRCFGPERRRSLLEDIILQIKPGRGAARAFEHALLRGARPSPPLPHVPEHETVHATDLNGNAQVSIIIPVYNYAHFLKEALDSTWHQDCGELDLIIVDDRSTDHSLDVALDWARSNGGRFNRIIVLQNLVNSGLGLTRNVGFAAAETPYVLPLDADNRLLPACARMCLAAIAGSGAAFVYPRIHQFGDTHAVVGGDAFLAARLPAGNYIDAMALVAKSAWAAVGGYDHVRFGWEDYDFWCRLVEEGFWGFPISDILAEYRVHGGSMLRRTTDIKRNKLELTEDMERRHGWVNVHAIAAVQDMVEARKQQEKRLAGRHGRPAARHQKKSKNVPL